MILPISLFQRAILNASRFCNRLAEAVPVKKNGVSTVSRTALFAEAEVVLPNGLHALIFSPLSTRALVAVERMTEQLALIESDFLCPYTILYDEITIDDASGKSVQGDVIMQILPEGESLTAYTTYSPESLAEMIDALRKEMHRIGFSHNNLKCENVIIGFDDRLHPIRYHYATLNGCNDDFADLYSLTGTLATIVSENEADYAFIKQNDLLAASEGLMIKSQESDGLYGFVDCEGKCVIPCRYIWVDDFYENRAIVATEEGVGVIDNHGNTILPTIFDNIEYDKPHSCFTAWSNNKAYSYRYNGSPCDPIAILREKSNIEL